MGQARVFLSLTFPHLENTGNSSDTPHTEGGCEAVLQHLEQGLPLGAGYGDNGNHCEWSQGPQAPPGSGHHGDSNSLFFAAPTELVTWGYQAPLALCFSGPPTRGAGSPWWPA